MLRSTKIISDKFRDFDFEFHLLNWIETEMNKKEPVRKHLDSKETNCHQPKSHNKFMDYSVSYHFLQYDRFTFFSTFNIFLTNLRISSKKGFKHFQFHHREKLPFFALQIANTMIISVNISCPLLRISSNVEWNACSKIKQRKDFSYTKFYFHTCALYYVQSTHAQQAYATFIIMVSLYSNPNIHSHM